MLFSGEIKKNVAAQQTQHDKPTVNVGGGQSVGDQRGGCC